MADVPSRQVAIVGAGYWGQNLVRNLAALDRLRWVCDSDPRTRERMASLYPGVRTTADLEEVLADPGVTAVMVIVPSSRHHEVASRCLDAGRHVYVEKPISLSVAHGEDLVARADAGERILMVGHLLLSHPCVDWLKARIDEGELGDVLYLTSQRVNLGKIRSDENAMWSLAPHDVSVALHLMGGTVVEVAAQGFTYLQRRAGIEDVVFLTLRFADGRAAQIHVSWLDPHKKRQLTVVGTRKMATFDDMSSEKVRVWDKGVGSAADDGSAPAYESYGDLLTLREGDVLIPRISMREPLRTLCEHFLRCIDTGAVPLTDGRSGVEVLRVLEAGQRSLERGGAPVMIQGSGGRRTGQAPGRTTP